MPLILRRRRAATAAFTLAVACLAGPAVSAEDAAPAPPAGQESPAPAGQGNAAPAEPQKPAVAEQELPSPQVQEALLRSTLLSFSDASTTGNWSVFLANVSDQMRAAVSADKLQPFNGWVTPLNDPSMLGSMAISPQLALMNNGNLLYLKGAVELRHSVTLQYEFRYLMTDKGWKLADMHIVNLATVPDLAGQQALVRSTFATFNDANISGDFSILYGKLAKAWRNEVTLEKFKEIYTPQLPDLTVALGKPLSLNSDPQIDENGRLKLTGKFNFSDSTFLTLGLTFIHEEEWKLAGIALDTHFRPVEGLAK